MSEERHPVVELLIARMESNPEEFGWGESTLTKIKKALGI